MALFKAQVNYVTNNGTGARCTLTLTADNEIAASKDAEAAVRAVSLEGVREIRNVTVTRNTLGVEFIGKYPV